MVILFFLLKHLYILIVFNLASHIKKLQFNYVYLHKRYFLIREILQTGESSWNTLYDNNATIKSLFLCNNYCLKYFWPFFKNNLFNVHHIPKSFESYVKKNIYTFKLWCCKYHAKKKTMIKTFILLITTLSHFVNYRRFGFTNAFFSLIEHTIETLLCGRSRYGFHDHIILSSWPTCNTNLPQHTHGL